MPSVPSGRLPGAGPTLRALQLAICCLLCLGAQGQVFPLQVEPQDPVLPAGGSLLVNCSTRCPQAELLSLETSLLKEPAGAGPGWAAFWLVNVTGDTRVLCSGFCNGSQLTGPSSITVYRFPERVELAPLPAWQPLGRNLTLRCLVAGGAPRARLSAVLLRGAEELSRRPAEGESVQFTVLAARADHGANFSCRAELDLRAQGLELFRNTSAPRRLRIFALPAGPPRLAAPRSLEAGRPWPVSCTLDGLFPASEARVQLALGNQILDPAVTSHGDRLRATATAHTDQEGTQEMVCSVTLGGQSREARRNLTVFAFLGPVLNLSDANVTEGSTVNVTCAAGAGVQLMLDGVLAPAPGEPARLQLAATERDDGRRFFCNATLEVDGELLQRNATVQLRVLYGPRIDQAKCPQRLAWRERTEHVLQCQARGNPAPQLQCLQEGSRVEVPVGTPFLVKLHHNGTYRCKATSLRGTHSLLVVMNVQARSSGSVNVIMGVLAALGAGAVTAALIYVFGMQKRCGTYHVKQPPSPSVPLTALQPEEPAGLQPS